MKILGIFLIAILSPASLLEAKWLPLTKQALIHEADAIVIADYVSFQNVKEVDSFYNQIGSFTLVKSIKGDVDKNFTVLGSNTLGCAPYISFQNLTPGSYLIFLSHRDFGWTDCSAFIQPITNEKVLWFSNDHDLEKVPTELGRVLMQIQSSLLKSSKKTS